MQSKLQFFLRELSGAMGDFGTLFPLAVGYIAIVGLNPAGIFIMLGLANIVTGAVYRLPMPLEPMKVLAVVAIAQRWQPSMVYACGFAMGLTWLVFSGFNVVGWIKRHTPNSVVRGIQISLGLMLTLKSLEFSQNGWALAAFSVVIVLLLRKNPFAPAAIVLVLLGVLIMAVKGVFNGISAPGLGLPPITGFRLNEIGPSFWAAGLAQIPLTATNAVIATAVLIRRYWPERPVKEKHLSLNMGIMNLVAPFFGGMPMCHGAGGLASQYYFGARTGWANVFEGCMEIVLGLCLAGSAAALLTAFPRPILGAMMLMVGIELVKFSKTLQWDKSLFPLGITVFFSLLWNMAAGFGAGMAVYYGLKWKEKISLK
jgi:MFS superfamily sulfate permease-like transporter